MTQPTSTTESVTCFDAGPKEGWRSYRVAVPGKSLAFDGKLFLRDLLGTAGLEMSLNVALPGEGIPLLHRHELNEELYFVLGGRGQFLLDDECVEVSEGSAIRCSPSVARAWRNHTTEPFYFVCIQYPADGQVQSGPSDGRRVERPLVWPD